MESIFFEKKKDILQIFFLRIWLDWRSLVELHIPNIGKQNGHFIVLFFLIKKFFKKIRFLKKKSNKLD